jgi:phage terminase large subunit-like protein
MSALSQDADVFPTPSRRFRSERSDRKLADKSLRHSGQGLMAWAVANARVGPKGNAIIITKQASGTAKIDPLMAAFT